MQESVRIEVLKLSILGVKGPKLQQVSREHVVLSKDMLQLLYLVLVLTVHTLILFETV
jgi:hypothetical protein